MKKLFQINGTIIPVMLFATLIILSGCANKEVVTECLKGHTFGFWGGLWHGIIAPIDLIAMIWRNDVSDLPLNLPRNRKVVRFQLIRLQLMSLECWEERY